jgi:hypothetical protein
MTKITDVELAERLSHIRDNLDQWSSPITAPDDLDEAASRLLRRADHKICVDEDVLFWAFRYALGRSSYAVNDVVSAVHENWSDLQVTTRERIHKEIKDWMASCEGSDTIMECDLASWSLLLNLPTC